jgi:hypothetical protein
MAMAVVKFESEFVKVKLAVVAKIMAAITEVGIHRDYSSLQATTTTIVQIMRIVYPLA